MNAETKQNLTRAITSVPKQDWENLFEFLRQIEYSKTIAAVTEDKRLEIHTAVKGITSLEETFKRVYTDKKFA